MKNYYLSKWEPRYKIYVSKKIARLFPNMQKKNYNFFDLIEDWMVGNVSKAKTKRRHV